MPNQPDTLDAPPVRMLVPASGVESLSDFLREARTFTAVPFAKARTALLDSLSQALLRHPRLRREPAGAALGFWLRRANLVVFEQGFCGRLADGRCVVPAGLVFHVTPANVDTMFIFSWALSFLAGNANVVRLTTRTSPLVDDLLECLNAVFAASPDVCRGNLFITYGHDDQVTGSFSAACDTRIVWGGDETVRRLRTVPLNPHATERSFASKRSLSVVVVGAFLALDEAGRRQIAERMASDLAPFNQMACSSPHVVYWVGGAPEECQRAAQAFGASLESAMQAKLGEPDLGRAVRRLNFAFEAVAVGRAEGVSHSTHTTQVFAREPSTAESAEVCGAGLLTHTMVELVPSVARFLGRNHQTITYFGLSDVERLELAREAGRAGVDRIVPIGRALDFGPYWDGYDLWSDLTRNVVSE